MHLFEGQVGFWVTFVHFSFCYCDVLIVRWLKRLGFLCKKFDVLNILNNGLQWVVILIKR